MKLLGAICLALSALEFCSGENRNCFAHLDEGEALAKCTAGFFKLEDCNNKFKCYGNVGEKCSSNNNRKTTNSYTICSKSLYLACAKDISSTASDYGWCMNNGFYPNSIKRNSLQALFRQRYALGLPFNNQNYNNVNDESDYPIDETKFSY